MKRKIKFLNLISLTTVSPVAFFFASCSCGSNPKEECKHTDRSLVSLFNNDNTGAIFKCNKCGVQFVDTPLPSEINMPIINIDGDFSKVSKETKEKMTCKYTNPLNDQTFEVDCTIKWQGNSGTEGDKKNYNIVFYEKDGTYENKYKVLLNDEWTKESKYTLKADWYETSFLRNITCCKLVGQGIKLNTSDLISKTVNGGCQDGFPCVLYQNNIFHGIYMIDIAKDQQMFKSKDGSIKPKYFLSCTVDKTDTAKLKKLIDDKFDQGIENEYCSGEVSEMITSFNNLITFGLNNEGQAFLDGINNYFDIDRTIDFLAFCQAFYLWDNLSNNINYVSFDGTKWYPSLYDMDQSFGQWCGSTIDYKTKIDFNSIPNNIICKIAKAYPDKIKEKYEYFRQNVLVIDNIYKVIDELDAKITSLSRKNDKEKWTAYPYEPSELMTKEFLKTWIKQRLEYLDNNW